MSFEKKYLKYKNKYLKLQCGGSENFNVICGECKSGESKSGDGSI